MHEQASDTSTRRRAHRAVIEAARRYEALRLSWDACIAIEGRSTDASRAAVLLALGVAELDDGAGEAPGG